MDVSQANDFKWFGEGFDGFPKVLPDDCAQYMIYTVDRKSSDFNVREQLRKVQAAATALTKSLLNDYIWQRDDFTLELVQRQGHSFLQGRTSFGDSIEDEWLVVYLLRRLSQQFKDCWMRIVDSDGEFLLVEAANALPKWLNPEVAENRVWMNDGKLLIIPRQGKLDKARGQKLSLDDALTFIQDRKPDLLHVPSIQGEALSRLNKYPAQIEKSLHRAVIVLPRKVIYILHENPAYISSAVEAFYLRDPIALRPLQSSDPSTLVFGPEDFVAVPVKFTKVGYAQVKGQEFPTPAAWASHPAKTAHMRCQPGAEVMGMKVACGFEMLLSDPHNVDKKPVREIKLLLEDVDSGEAQLSSDKDIADWDWRVDDEGWLDINFEDFEKELSGQPGAKQTQGFGDKEVQEDLRNLVARFQDFLQDDDGMQDSEDLDEMDDDDDSDEADNVRSKDGESSDGGGLNDFDENQFQTMMRDMMGLPPATPNKSTNSDAKPKPEPRAAVQKGDNESDEEEEEIRKVMHQVQNELQDAGAL
ncbi:MAG: hypothetical protein Q9183_000879 [Haloplaca sp. 2 TL-2023]